MTAECADGGQLPRLRPPRHRLRIDPDERGHLQATGRGEYTNAVYDFWIKRNRAATQKAAMLYLNAGAASENARTQIAVGKKRGMNWVYTSGIDVAEFNYGPYVQ